MNDKAVQLEKLSQEIKLLKFSRIKQTVKSVRLQVSSLNIMLLHCLLTLCVGACVCVCVCVCVIGRFLFHFNQNPRK